MVNVSIGFSLLQLASDACFYRVADSDSPWDCSQNNITASGVLLLKLTVEHFMENKNGLGSAKVAHEHHDARLKSASQPELTCRFCGGHRLTLCLEIHDHAAKAAANGK